MNDTPSFDYFCEVIITCQSLYKIESIDKYQIRLDTIFIFKSFFSCALRSRIRFKYYMEKNIIRECESLK